jgi:hypothetical protein
MSLQGRYSRGGDRHPDRPKPPDKCRDGEVVLVHDAFSGTLGQVSAINDLLGTLQAALSMEEELRQP